MNLSLAPQNVRICCSALSAIVLPYANVARENLPSSSQGVKGFELSSIFLETLTILKFLSYFQAL